ncbi:MAG: hypothetical protein WDN27_05385 [Candidatus Saccharibacteria bacterium]
MLKKHEQLRVHDLLEAGVSVAEVARRTNTSRDDMINTKRIGRHIQSWASLSEDDKIPKDHAALPGLARRPIISQEN